MEFEVEQKHRIEDAAAWTGQLAERGAVFGSTVRQVDQYYAHPCRDFSQTDEALRIRSAGSRSFVTYKGPKLDTATKTRRELELPLDSSDPAGSRFAELLEAIGFRPVAVVEKTRCLFRLTYGGRVVEGALDEIADLGTFVELELCADESNLAAAQKLIGDLAAELNLGSAERRSYLEMLLEQRKKRDN